MGRLCPNAVLGCGCPPDSRGTLYETSLGLRRHRSAFLRASYCSTVGFDGLRARCRPNQVFAIMRKNADVVHHGHIDQHAVGIVGVEILVAVAAGTNGGPLPRANQALQRYATDSIRRVRWPAPISGSLQVVETRIVASD